MHVQHGYILVRRSRAPHAVLRKKELPAFVRVRSVHQRSCATGVRTWSYVSGNNGDEWLEDLDVRKVRIPEADMAIGWLIGFGIPYSLNKAERDEHGKEPPKKLTPKQLWREWQKKPKGIDLCSGAGDFSLGMAQGGFNVVGHVEWEKLANSTYALNEPGGPFDELIGEDITQISDYDIADFARRRGPIATVFGSPPCQGFSTSGKRDPKDPRNSLFMEFVRFCRIIRPPSFALENVPGMRSMKTAKGEYVMPIIVKSLEDLGYTVDWAIPNAANYGAPQERRIILQGNLNEGQHAGIHNSFHFARGVHVLFPMGVPRAACGPQPPDPLHSPGGTTPFGSYYAYTSRRHDMGLSRLRDRRRLGRLVRLALVRHRLMAHGSSHGSRACSLTG